MATYDDYNYDSDCDYDDFEDRYVWAEAGGWELADELASGAIPDPPALYYRDDDLEEYDDYNFWSELEFGDAEICDGEIALDDLVQNAKPHDKKKKSKAADLKDTIKKIRLQGICEYPTILWKSSSDAFSLRHDCPVYQKPQKPTALLPHWGQLLENRPLTAIASPVKKSSAEDKSEEQDEEGWEDMSDAEDKQDGRGEEDEGEEDDEGMNLQDIDPHLLKSVLVAKLSSSGMAGADQTALMESLMQMLNGGGGADTDNLLESLTSNLLEQVTQGGADSSMGQWLSGQGVSLEEGDEEEEEDKAPTVLPTATLVDLSPKDSVAADLAANSKASSPKTAPQRKDKTTGKKRKQVSFDAPSEPSSAAPILETGHSNKRTKKATTTPAQPPGPAPASVVDGPANKTSKAQTRAAKTEEKALPAGKVEKETLLKPEPASAASRKRKAPSEQAPEEKPKRQLRNFAAPTASSQNKTAEAKTTRSGRTRK